MNNATGQFASTADSSIGAGGAFQSTDDVGVAVSRDGAGHSVRQHLAASAAECRGSTPAVPYRSVTASSRVAPLPANSQRIPSESRPHLSTTEGAGSRFG